MSTTSTYKLQLTNDFFVEINQIARLLGAACGRKGQVKVSPLDYAEEIGVTQRRIESLSSIAVAFGLLKRTVLTATPLGQVVYRCDPFLSDLGTLWLLHYTISSNPRHVVWNRLVNRVIPENERFSTALARPYFDDLAQVYSERSIREHLGGEMASFWNAYLEQDFSHLNLLQAESEQVFRKGTPEPLPAPIFYLAVCAYREQFAPQAVTLEIPTLVNAENSPGRVLFQNERRVRELLEQAAGAGHLFIESRADLDQVRFRQLGVETQVETQNLASLLETYYQER